VLALLVTAATCFFCFGEIEIIESLRWVDDCNQAETGDREHLQKVMRVMDYDT
jgi:hypothetical protein